MSKQKRTLAVDEFIRERNKEPDRYGFMVEDPLNAHAGYKSGFEVGELSAGHLPKMSDAALEGRLVQYERDYAFERDPQLRGEFKTEVARTKAEIKRRKDQRVKEAIEKAFPGSESAIAVLSAEAA